MDKNNDVAILAKHLKQELAWVKELNTILEQEKHALAKRQFDKLEDFAQQKQDLSNKLEESAKEKIKLVGDPQTQSPSTFLNDFLKHCSPEDARFITDLSNELADHLNLCRELNTVNGQVIATNMSTRQEIVNILSGKKGKDVNLYTSTGDIKNSSKGEGGTHQKA